MGHGDVTPFGHRAPITKETEPISDHEERRLMATMTQADRARYGSPEIRRRVQGRSYEEVVAIRDGLVAQAKLAAMKELSEDDAHEQWMTYIGERDDPPVAVAKPHPLDYRDEEALVLALGTYLEIGGEQRLRRTYAEDDPADPDGPVTADEVELARQLDVLTGC